MVPLFIPVLAPYGVDLIWFGIVTTVGAGLVCRHLRSVFPATSLTTLADDRISLLMCLLRSPLRDHADCTDPANRVSITQLGVGLRYGVRVLQGGRLAEFQNTAALLCLGRVGDNFDNLCWRGGPGHCGGIHFF